MNTHIKTTMHILKNVIYSILVASLIIKRKRLLLILLAHLGELGRPIVTNKDFATQLFPIPKYFWQEL